MKEDKAKPSGGIDNIKFYMTVPLPDGSATAGKIDYRHVPAKLGLDAIRFDGMHVLDIAANDGFWTFWAEQQGAADLLAIDVDSFENYDWSWGGPPEGFKTPADAASQWAEAGAGFWAIHHQWNSKARRETKSIYDLSPEKDGIFDVIFNFGLLYHLRHPLLALDRARAVCRGVMILETHLVNGLDTLPVNLFYRRTESGGITNWSGPAEASVVNWLVSAGFPIVFSNKTNTKSPYARRIFIACVDEVWAAQFRGNPNLISFGDDYLDASLETTRALLSGKLALKLQAL